MSKNIVRKEDVFGDLELIRSKAFYMKIAEFSKEQLDGLIDMIEQFQEKYQTEED